MATPRRTASSGNRVTFDDKAPMVESWTLEQTVNLLSDTHLSPVSTLDALLPAEPSASTPRSPSPLIRGTSTPLSIPLDTPTRQPRSHTPPSAPRPRRDSSSSSSSSIPRAHHTVHGRRTPLRRDSLKRREALLRGKEGSRRRQRWENDRLLHVPGAQPPLPSDWAQPVWPEAKEGYRPVPYFLAPLWEGRYKGENVRRRAEEKSRRGRERTEEEGEKEKVARELRERLKKARGAKGLLQDLELEVRNFLLQVEAQERLVQKESGVEEEEIQVETDDEIVFVGRQGSIADGTRRSSGQLRLERAERLIFQSLERDHGASFGRWLVHSIADYYGLETWSVTSGDPAQRSAYVGLKTDSKSNVSTDLPRPLWVMV